MREMPRRVAAFFLPAEDAGREVVWQPRADIYHTRDGWLVKLELAGVRPDEDVTIWARGSRLTVSGIRRDRLIEKGWSCYAMEIAYSRFERSIELPFDVEKARLAVECRDGMLLVRIAAEGHKA
jgi:HSP20 family protein